MNKPKCTQYKTCEYKLEPARPCMLDIYYKCKHFDMQKWATRHAVNSGLLSKCEGLR